MILSSGCKDHDDLILSLQTEVDFYKVQQYLFDRVDFTQIMIFFPLSLFLG